MCTDFRILRGSAVKNLPSKQEMQVLCLDQEDPLEKEMATHSSILTWGPPRTEESCGLHSLQGCKEVDTTEQTEHTPE